MLTISHQFKSPNISSREGAAIRCIILHATVGNLVSARRHLCDPATKVSSHYLIGKDGTTFQLVADADRAHHAGTSAWRGTADVNDFSIGIELENANDGRDPWPAAQLTACRELCQQLLTAYNLTPDCIDTHAAVALPKNRKTDPLGFPLESFRALLITPATRYTELSPLLNTPTVTTIPIWPARSRQYTAYDVREMVRAYQRQCAAVGLDWFLAWAQTWHETGGLGSFWSQRPRRNPAGIGVNGDVQPGHAANGRPTPQPGKDWAYDDSVGLWRAGLSFATWADHAIPAHLGRLLGYALPLDQMNAQQRQLFTRATQARPLPTAILGTAPVIKLLGAMHNPTGQGWADDGEFYGRSIAKIANSLVGDL